MESQRDQAIVPATPTAQLYDRLPSRHVRLLQVVSGAETSNEPILCRLIVAELASAPVYAALSYVWGTSSSPPDYIVCDGHRVNVTINCHAALQHLRAIHGSFCIWVDAICINQGDRDDKRDQIGLMGEIYSLAHTTYIWLGAGNATNQRVLGYLSQTGFLEHFYEKGNPTAPKLVKPRVWSALFSYVKGQWGWGSSKLPHVARSTWARSGRYRAELSNTECTDEDLSQFFDCVWISRIWTYQEVILSRNPVVVYGHVQIPWGQLEHSIIFLASIRASVSDHLRKWVEVVFTRDLHRGALEDVANHQSRLLDYWKFCNAIANMHHRGTPWKWIFALVAYLATIVPLWLHFKYQNRGTWLGALAAVLTVILPFFYPWLVFEGIPRLAPNPRYPYAIAQNSHFRTERYLRSTIYERILETLVTRSATEPRDMCFGLQAILNELPQDQYSMTTDYNLTKSEVYQQLTLYMMHKLSSLQTLKLAAQHHFEGAPSWVPDYSQNFQDFRTLLRLRGTDAAASSSVPFFKLHPDYAGVLVVKGHFLDYVTSVSIEWTRVYDPLTTITTHTPGTWIHTASFEGWSCGDVAIGDRLILISGVSVPLVVKEDGEFVKIVAPANLFVKTTDTKNQPRNGLMVGDVWEAYETRRRKEWLEAQSEAMSNGRSVEPDPAVYLEDMFVS